MARRSAPTITGNAEISTGGTGTGIFVSGSDASADDLWQQ